MLVSSLFGLLLANPRVVHADWRAPTVRFDQLPKRASTVRKALEVDGVLVVERVPRLVESSAVAFASLTKCGALTATSTNSMGVFKEFVVRRRLTSDVQDEMTNAPCNVTVSQEFRYLLHYTGVNVARALSEKALEFVKKGTRKEQFHRYASSESSLSIHPDAGFFLAMISRWDDASIRNEIEIETPEGDLAILTLPSDAVLILGGEGFGMAREVLGADVRAVPHAPVIKDLNSSRFWYGVMFLPEDDFPIAADLKMKDWLSSARSEEVGRMPSRYPHGSALRDLRATCSREDEMYCWKTCIDTRRMICRNATDSGVCRNNAGRAHHFHECKAEPNPNYVVKETPFCLPQSGTTMFMRGFRTVFAGGEMDPCPVFFFEGANLDKAWKFVMALCTIVMLGIGSEALSRARKHLEQQGAPISIRIALYACNVTIGYFVMLAAMAYSFEYFVAATFGLTIGHALFNMDNKVAPVGQTPRYAIDSTIGQQQRYVGNAG
eukprot:GEMP01008138.1.p1 GENE.GEMP01008138.1~~GEMP01008138.1.p1  ORF type:complete len:494 (+),score=104.16 GEMP01008138.1:104-1585(+)